MGVGIALGNTIDSVGPTLQKGEFVGVSIPIGMALILHHRSHHFYILTKIIAQPSDCL